MPRRDRKKKKHKSKQQEQQAHQAQHDGGDGGEEIGHEVKHEAAAGQAVQAAVQRPAARPAIEYRYSPDDINLLAKALDGANRAIHYLSKKELVHHSHIIELIQALQDTSNCLHQIIPARIDEELNRNIAWEQRQGSKYNYYIADRLVAAHASSMRSLLSSMQCDLGYLHEWCGEFRELAIQRVTWGRFKEIESTVSIKEQAKAKAECISVLTAVPKIVDVEIFDLPLHDPQLCFNAKFGRPLANIWEALNIIKHISPNVPQQPLIQSKKGVTASAVMVVVENLKKLPRDHGLRNDISWLIKLRNELSHSTGIDGFTYRPGYFFSRYIEPFMQFRSLVEPIINSMLALVGSNGAVEEGVLDGGYVQQDVTPSYRETHTNIFERVSRLKIVKSNVAPVYQEDGRIFTDEELLSIVFRILFHDKELALQILKDIKSYTQLRIKSFLNTPMLYSYSGSRKTGEGLEFVYTNEETRYFAAHTLTEVAQLNANTNCPKYRNVYVFEYAVKLTLTALKYQNNLDTSMVKELLAWEANPNIETFYPHANDVINPLILSVIFAGNKGGLLQLLLENGARANLKTVPLFVHATRSETYELTEEFIKLMLRYGIDPINEFETAGGATYNVIGFLAFSGLSDQEACSKLLKIVRAIIPMYGMAAIKALLSSTFIEINKLEKTLMMDSINTNPSCQNGNFKNLVNIVLQLSSQDNELAQAIASNDLKSIHQAFAENHDAAVQAIRNMKLYSIKQTDILANYMPDDSMLNKNKAASKALQDEMVDQVRSCLDKNLQEGLRQELFIVNYHRHHKGPATSGEKFQVLVVQHQTEAVRFNDLVRLFCDSNVAKQVIAWSKHGVGKVKASTPALELKDDGMKVLVAAGENKPTVSKAVSIETRMEAFFKAVLEEAAAKAERIRPHKTITANVPKLNIEGGRAGVKLEAHDGSLMPLDAAATKVVTIEERAAEEVESILAAAAKLIVASRASAAANAGAKPASAQALITSPEQTVAPTSAPTQSPTLSPTVVSMPISSEVVSIPKTDKNYRIMPVGGHKSKHDASDSFDVKGGVYAELQAMANKYKVKIEIIDQRTAEAAFKKIALATHPDKTPLSEHNQDFLRADELVHGKPVSSQDPYVSAMSGLDKGHQGIRIAGSVADTLKMLKDPNVNTITTAVTGYGHIAEIFGKNLGMKYLAPIGIGSQLYQEDYTGAAKSTAMLLGRMVPVALMPVAPAVAVIVKVGFIGYDTYKVYQDMVELRDLICGQIRGDDEPEEL